MQLRKRFQTAIWWKTEKRQPRRTYIATRICSWRLYLSRGRFPPSRPPSLVRETPSLPRLLAAHQRPNINVVKSADITEFRVFLAFPASRSGEFCHPQWKASIMTAGRERRGICRLLPLPPYSEEKRRSSSLALENAISSIATTSNSSCSVRFFPARSSAARFLSPGLTGRIYRSWRLNCESSLLKNDCSGK